MLLVLRNSSIRENCASMPRSETRRRPATQSYRQTQDANWRKPYAHSRKSWLAWIWRLRLLAYSLSTLHRIGCVLQSEIRSLFGRIPISLSRTQWVDFGKAFERLPNGSLSPNKRTADRIAGTRELMSRHPWASSVDRLIYLEG